MLESNVMPSGGVIAASLWLPPRDRWSSSGEMIYQVAVVSVKILYSLHDDLSPGIYLFNSIAVADWAWACACHGNNPYSVRSNSLLT